MKTLLNIALFLLFTIGLRAQPSITSNVLPVMGDTILMSYDSTLVSAGVSGANVNWDFSTILHQDLFFERIYLNPINSPYSSIFPNSKLCRTDGIGSAYSYWDNSNSTKSVCYGFVEPNYYDQNYNTLPISYYKFPMSFGNTYTDSVSATTNPGNLKGSGKYYFSADAWGTIKLPHKTVNNVLRTKSVLYIGDSSATVNSYSLTTEYSWYQANKKEPLLIIYSVIINHYLYKKFVIFDNNSLVGVPEITEYNSIVLSPNPTNNSFCLKVSNFEPKENCLLTVFDISGKELIVRKMNKENFTSPIDISCFPQGIYFVQIQNGDEVVMKKLVKE